MPKSRSSPPALLVVVGLSAFSSSCWFGRAPKPFTPPPPETQPQLPSRAPAIAAKPPSIDADASIAMPPAPVSIPEIPPPPAPKPVPRRNPPTPQQQPTTPTPTPPAPQTPPPIRLGQIYTPEEQRDYNRVIDESLNHVKRALDSLARKALNPDQQEVVNRIATFQKQAEQARESQDLLTAKNLAQRADTLAQDLLGRIP